MDKKTKAAFVNAAAKLRSLEEVLKYITENNIPYEIGCYFIAGKKNPKEVYSVFQSEAVDIKFRLYALKTLARLEYEEEDIVFYVNNQAMLRKSMIHMLGEKGISGSMSEIEELAKLKELNKGTPLITETDKEVLASAAETVVNGETYRDINNMFSSNIDAEVLMISLIMMVSFFADVDIVQSLKKMPAVMSFKSGTGHEMLIDSHGRLILQDLNNDKALRKFIDDLGQYIVLKSGAFKNNDISAYFDLRKSVIRKF
jgi:hypothetical protein